MRIKLLTVLILLNVALRAQPYFSVAEAHFANQPVSTFYKGEDEQHISNNWSFYNLNVPLQINHRNIIVFSPGYESRNYKSADSNQRIYTFYLPLTYQYTFKDTNNNISATAIYRYNSISSIKPGIHNDMLGGAILFTHVCNTKFDYKVGAYYNKEFYGNYFLPLIGFDWQASDRLFVFGLLPNSATADYRVSNDFHFGLNYGAAEESYRFKGNNNPYFHFLEVQLRLFADYYIPKTPVVITLEAGHTMLRNYEYHGENLSEETTTVKPAESAVFRVGIAYRFITNNAFRSMQIPVH